jgi:hypothetical protein
VHERMPVAPPAYLGVGSLAPSSSGLQVPVWIPAKGQCMVGVWLAWSVQGSQSSARLAMFQQVSKPARGLAVCCDIH